VPGTSCQAALCGDQNEFLSILSSTATQHGMENSFIDSLSTRGGDFNNIVHEVLLNCEWHSSQVLGLGISWLLHQNRFGMDAGY
jgi:hypothetical protein